MARKGAQRSDPGRRAGSPAAAVAAPPSSLRLERAFAVTVALSIALALVLLYVHEQLAATHGTYTSFCNVGTRVNCDAVLTSTYSRLLGLPVAAWALVTYLALAVLLLVRARVRERLRARVTALLLALALWSLAFSLYMAGVAAFAIGAICLLCSGLYVLNGTLAALGWQLARADAPPARPIVTGGRLAGGIALMAGFVALLGASQRHSRLAAADLTPADVESRNPDFYRWYTSLPLADALPPGDHVRGPADAPITVVEFSDFECAFCAKAFRDLRDLEHQHEGLIRVEFHHFPLDTACNAHVQQTMHQSACRAAIAAECAARFGRFWEYHDRLFGAQDRLGRDALVATAVDLGIDRAAFTACVDDPAAGERVAADTAEGARLGVRSTPTLFINRHPIEGALDRSLYDYVLALERHS